MQYFRNFLSRALGLNHNGKRDYSEIYGYPDSLSGDNGFRLMYLMTQRNGIAARLNWGMPKLCWRNGFELFENQEKDASQIMGDEIRLLKKSRILDYIERADTLNRIGRYSVLLLGIPDSKALKDPLGKVARNGANWLDKLWFQPYAYDSVIINKWNTDETSPRYGMPEEYTLFVNDKDESKNQSTVSSRVVHWSRIIHLNEGALESDIEGRGYLEPIFNVLLNLDKVCGGSSEAYFRNAKGKIVFELDKEFADFFAENSEAEKKHKENVEDFTNSFKDQISMSGGKAYTLDTPMYTPKDTILGNMQQISGYSGYPLRVLTGEGAGQLAGSEDRVAMNSLVAARQESFGYRVVLEILERFRIAGMLNLPDYYDIRFPNQEESSEDQKVANNQKRADTFQKVAATIQALGGAPDITSTFAYFGFEDIDIDADIELIPEPDKGGADVD